VFVDEAKILVKAGSGGNGCVAFRREKFVPRGGPSGGDGGHCGSIYLEANPNDNTLLRYRYNREFKADRGRHGEGSNCTGHSGDDMICRFLWARWFLTRRTARPWRIGCAGATGVGGTGRGAVGARKSEFREALAPGTART